MCYYVSGKAGEIQISNRFSGKTFELKDALEQNELVSTRCVGYISAVSVNGCCISICCFKNQWLTGIEGDRAKQMRS